MVRRAEMRAGLTDTLLHRRAWVRDETTIPVWWDPVTDGDRVRVVADRVRGPHAPYDAACAAAWAPYDAARAADRATYDAASAAAWAPYHAAVAPAKATYETVIRTMDGYVPALSS